MKYYALFYLTDGTIHLKPYETKEGAENCIKQLSGSRKDIEYCKVIKKDLTKDSYKGINGHWVG